jgi:hypothetical protein
MFKMRTHMLLAAVLCLGGLTAQQNIVYADGDPSPTTGGGNAFPFGSVGIRYQSIFPHSLFGPGPLNIVTIRDILVSGHTTDLEAVYDDIEIRMGPTKQSAPTTDWATNLPLATAKTVYRGPLRIRFTNGVWGGIGLPKPYLYLPLANTDNLCVEVIVWAASQHTANFYYPKASGLINRAFRYGWVANQTQPALTGTSGCRMAFVLNNGNIATAGQGCNSSANTPLLMTNDTWPQLGQPVKFSLGGAAAFKPGFLVLGAQVIAIDLGIAGSPGCVLWNDPLLGVPVVTDAQGGASLTATVPQNTLPATLYGHWLVLENPRLTTSDYQTIIIGN